MCWKVGDDRATSTLVVSLSAASDETTSGPGEPARLGSAGSTVRAVAKEARHVARLLDIKLITTKVKAVTVKNTCVEHRLFALVS